MLCVAVRSGHTTVQQVHISEWIDRAPVTVCAQPNTCNIHM